MKSSQQDIYDRARKKVDAIKGFHTHIGVYIVINILILLFRANILSILRLNRVDLEFERWLDLNTWGTVLFWGIGLAIHGLYVYRFKFGFIKRWEERKLKEFMEKEDSNDFKSSM